MDVFSRANLLRLFKKAIFPLARVALEHNLRFEEFVEAAREAFVEASALKLEAKKKRVSAKGISDMTGIDRRHTKPENMKPEFSSAQIFMHHWAAISENELDNVQSLSIKQFNHIVEVLGSELDSEELLDELVSLGLASVKEDSIYFLKQGYFPIKKLEKLRLLGDHSYYFLGSVANNINSMVSEATESLSQESKPKKNTILVSLEDVPEEHRTLLKKTIQQRLRLYQAEIDLLIKSEKRRLDVEEKAGESTVRVGAGFFYFNE